ncbi:MAG: hypothetical protein ABH834_08015 [Candidatus Altiarchaeota archaeon]
MSKTVGVALTSSLSLAKKPDNEVMQDIFRRNMRKTMIILRAVEIEANQKS